MYDEMYQEIEAGCDDESEGELVDTILRLVVFTFPNFPDIYFEQDSDDEEDMVKNFLIRGFIASFLQLHTSCSLDEPTYTKDELLTMCPGLISRNADNLLTIPHASVIQYFQHYYPNVFSWKAGHAFLTSLCIKRLQLHDTYPLTANSMFDCYCAFHWSLHLLELSVSSSETGFIGSALDEEDFASDIVQFLNNRRSPVLVSEAGKIISKCLEMTGRDYTPKRFARKARVDSSSVSISYRSHLLFCPDHEFSMLPIRCALDYKPEETEIATATQPIAPFETRDLSLYGLASLLGNHRNRASERSESSLSIL